MRPLLSRHRRAFLKDDAAAAVVEYGVLIALVAAVCLATVRTLGRTVSGNIAAAAAALKGGTDAGGNNRGGNNPAGNEGQGGGQGNPGQ